MKPIAWYDPTNDVVSTDKDSPLFTPLGQVRPLYLQSEQKPVAIYRAGQVKGEVYHVQFLKGMEADEVLLYAAPPQRTWVGLTDQEIEEAIDDGFAFGLNDGNISNDYVIRYVRVIEAKLKDKNVQL